MGQECQSRCSWTLSAMLDVCSLVCHLELDGRDIVDLAPHMVADTGRRRAACTLSAARRLVDWEPVRVVGPWGRDLNSHPTACRRIFSIALPLASSSINLSK
jgi:hypothetical protein